MTPPILITVTARRGNQCAVFSSRDSGEGWTNEQIIEEVKRQLLAAEGWLPKNIAYHVIRHDQDEFPAGHNSNQRAALCALDCAG